MNLKKRQIVSFLLLVTMICTYYIYPENFKTDGGSCYQGITLMIDRLFLIICGLLTIISIIILKFKKDLSLKIGVVSTSIWLLWCIAILIESFVEFLYLLPFLSLSILNIVLMAKNKLDGSKQDK